jgi:hypothetical protein
VAGAACAARPGDAINANAHVSGLAVGIDWTGTRPGESTCTDERADPYELHNLVKDPSYASQLQFVRTRMKQLCSPPPPGFTL